MEKYKILLVFCSESEEINRRLVFSNNFHNPRLIQDKEIINVSLNIEEDLYGFLFGKRIFKVLNEKL